MANLMQRFLRNQSVLRSIPKLTPNLITTHQKPCIVESLSNPVITFSGIKPDEAMRFYPSFPIGYGLNTSVEEKKEEEVVIYADSVKKKRKKKMNKHKYRKLRKKQGR